MIAEELSGGKEDIVSHRSIYRWSPSRLAVAVAAFLCGGEAAAQTVTAIVPDTAPQLTTNTVVVPLPAPPGRTIVGIEGGRYTGPAGNPYQNLFHSFQRFDLGAGDTARWTGSNAADVRYIINRVTGGDISDLDGTIDASGYPNADFYFINPAGVAFGAGARVNVPRAFYVSTADTLNFADATQLRAASADGSTFSMAAPASFGFLGAQGDIVFRGDNDGSGARIVTGAASAAHFSARDIHVDGANLVFEDTMVRMAAVGAAAMQLGVDPRQSLPVTSGEIRLTNGRLAVWSPTTDLRGDEAAIELSAGELRMIGGDERPSPGVNAAAIRAGGLGGPSGSADGGDIMIRAARIFMDGRTHIGILGDAGGAPYALTLNVRELLDMQGLQNSTHSAQIGALGTTEFGSARIDIFGPQAALRMSNAAIRSRTGLADAGDITITVGDATLAYSHLETSSSAGGAAGDINLNADTLKITEGRIETVLVGAGQAGAVNIRVAGAVTMGTGIPPGREHIVSRTSGPGEGGAIRITAGSITLTDGFHIATSTTGAGRGGNVEFVTTNGSINLTRAAIGTISGLNAPSDALWIGRAGSILFRSAEDIILSNTNISSTAIGLSSGTGSIQMLAADRFVSGFLPGDRLSMAPLPDNSPGGLLQLVSSATGDIGSEPVGSIDIRAREIELLDQEPFDPAATAARARVASETSGSQPGGAISLVATQNIRIDHADVVSQSISRPDRPAATGRAGDVRIEAPNVTFLNGTASSESLGDYGTALASRGNAGAVNVIASNNLLLDNRSIISTSSSGFGAGGAVNVTIGRMGSILGYSRIQSDILGDATVAGHVQINGPNATLRIAGFDRSILTNAPRSAVSTSTGTSGTGGSIAINVDRLEFLDGGVAIAAAVGPGNGVGGTIRISARIVLADGMGSGVAATSLDGGGGAGAIEVRAERLIMTDGAVITTNGENAPAGDIIIIMSRDGLIILRGRQNEVTITTSSDTLTGGRITIGEPRAIISDGARILALGEAGGANVRITSGYLIRSSDRLNQILVNGNLVLDSEIEDVSEGTQELEARFVDPFGILIGRCAGTRNDGLISQLGISTVGPFSVRARRRCDQPRTTWPDTSVVPPR
ncbi:MAG TPA: filamentous hemagglutinin N-terminal domain-containing protein [Allosphingosinicella sp.]|nr:filamentous hemagglutinin N-terminal domain-containing protein [Allosphingosinicella sp.]